MKILFATDGSECAHAAVDFMERFPFPRVGEAEVLTVVNRDDFKGKEEERLDEEQRKILQEAREMVQEESETLLAQSAERLRKAGWTVSTEVRDGHPAEEIVVAAEEHGIDLIVMGCHGLSGINRVFLGSISDTVLKHAHCSVLIVKSPLVSGDAAVRARARQALHVLLAYDGSDAARKAVEFCAALPFGEADEVAIISVLPYIGLYRQDIRQRLSGIWREKKRQAAQALERAAREPNWTTSFVSTQLRESRDVSQAILNAASELETDLLVLGYKGKGAIEKFLLGSITAGIVHHAPCSILAVR
jgi:nucleotide-binding universal stress UspA family protein